MLKKFIEKGRKAKRINFPYTNKEEILKKLSLVNKNNKLLNAGYILFAKEAKLEMQMAIFATETKLTFLDIDQVFGNIFELIEIGEGYIRKNGFMVIFYRKTDEELLDLTGENKNTQEKTYEKTYENTEEKILQFCTKERTAKEIAEYCGYKGIDRFKRNYLKPLLEQEKIKMTIPDKPKSKNQKYIRSK